MTASRRFASYRLRRGRYSEAGRIYLITATTRNRAPVFANWRAGRIVVRTLMAEAAYSETLCYVIMPDHFHWLLQLGEGQNLSGTMQRVKSVSAHRLGSVHGRGVWQTGYHDRALRREDDVRDCARYVVANPLRAGLVKSLGDYPLWDAIWL